MDMSPCPASPFDPRRPVPSAPPPESSCSEPASPHAPSSFQYTTHCYEYARYAEPPPGCVPAPHYVPQLVPPHNPDFIATIQSAGTIGNRLPSDNLQAAHFYGRYEQPLPPIFDGSRSMYITNGSSQSNYSIPRPIDDSNITSSALSPENVQRRRRTKTKFGVIFFVVIIFLFSIYTLVACARMLKLPFPFDLYK